MRAEQRVQTIKQKCIEAHQALSRNRRKRYNEIHRELMFLVKEQIDYEIEQERVMTDDFFEIEPSHHCAKLVTELASVVWALSDACNDAVKLREVARDWETIEAAHSQLGRMMDRILKNSPAREAAE